MFRIVYTLVHCLLLILQYIHVCRAILWVPPGPALANWPRGDNHPNQTLTKIAIQVYLYFLFNCKIVETSILCWASQDSVQRSNPVSYKRSYSSFTTCEYLESALCAAHSAEVLWTLLFMNGERQRQEISHIMQTLKVNRHVFPIPSKCQGQ